jgi:RNA polymerase sigma-70 factor (ECF subfamily)
VCQAHADAGTRVDAQRQLWDRYGAAVRRYLLGALRDADAADEMAQEFALRFVRGNLRGADPGKGRFRDFLKGALSNLIADYRRRLQRRRPEPFLAESPEPDDLVRPADDPDRGFLENWRDELLHRAWCALELLQQQTGQPFHDVLRFRADHVEMRSAQMAEQLSARLGRPVTADWVRQTLRRARTKFADFLIAEVVPTLPAPTLDELERELLDVGLLTYCQPALDRYRRGT